ncbi:Maf family nucleotide pyrophosphatase [Chitiniphilus eburneus]|uniref:Maf family nucleotide pyrophosphatase n=1 Tax=Chitiniphilus eburneus TaxID=2571148 RepID=UPI0035D077CB
MQKQASSPSLVLASTSPYRRELLARLGLPFDVAAPDVDETPLPGESAAATSLRLAVAKAQALAARYPAALLIGSDQVALLDGEQLGKPGTHERAVTQLRAMRGRRIDFHTAVALHNSASGVTHTHVDITGVTMRDYTDAEIEAYLRREQPYDCAGSAKTEGLGTVMIAALENRDPAAIVGLPLIALCDMLRAEGVALL